MLKALILEQDRTFRQLIEQSLLNFAQSQIVFVPSWQSACLQLGVETFDVALIRENQAKDATLMALRYVQPTLPIVLAFPAALPQEQKDRRVPIQGTISLDWSADAVREALDRAAQSDVPDISEIFHYGGGKRVSQEDILPILELTELGENVHTVLFSHLSGFVSHRGDISSRMAAALAAIARRSWQDDSFLSLAQFLRIPGMAGDWLLYSHRLEDGYSVSFLAWNHAALSLLRIQMEMLAGAFAQRLNIAIPVESLPKWEERLPATKDSKTFAIIWRSIEKMPATLHIPLRRALERIAEDNGCQIQHLTIKANYVQMVVNCPPGRNSIWVANRFKSGSEAEILQQFGIRATLWAKGYYATESAVQLSDDAVNLFLKRSYQMPDA